MDESEPPSRAAAGRAKRLGRRLLALGANRFALLEVELREARNEALSALVLLLGATAFAALAVSAFSAAIVLAFWQTSPVGVLLGLAALHGTISIAIVRTLGARRRRWKMLPETASELRKDLACLEKAFL